MAQKIVKRAFFALLIVFAFIGLHKSCMWLQFRNTRSMAEEIESRRPYDKDLLYHKNGGEPLFLVRPGNRATLFFMEGFRTQSPAGMYMGWLKEIHGKNNVNVVVPVYGLQSSPFRHRNREWHFQEDLRTVLQTWDAYTATLSKDHRVVLVAQSFGTFPASAIAVRAKRSPDQIVFLSPLNTGMEFKAAGELVYWFSKQTAWLQHVLLFTKAEPAPKRASVWDIVNKEKNLAMAARGDVNPEDSSRYGYLVEKAAKWMDENLVPRIKGKRITVVWGDSDLYFSQKGFREFAGKLAKSGNAVRTVTLKDSGHMVLLDNGEARLKQIIADALAGR